VGTAADPDAPIGKTASHFGVYFLKRPGGGPFEIRVDGKGVKEVSTRSSETELGYDELTVEDAPHKVTYVAKGTVRLLGATLGRDAPNSVTVDSLGVGSLNAWALARLDTRVNRAMLTHRDFDLVMFLVGTNMYALEKHHEWMGRVIRHHRLATPEVPLLFFSPPDITLGNKGRKTDPRIHKVAEQLHDIAREHGAAFWDFHAAMGGDRSIVAFRQKKWAQADIIHFTDEGSFFMGRRVLLALWRGFLAALDSDPNLACGSPAR
jgi:lysophospholipase L1-like esterase